MNADDDEEAQIREIKRRGRIAVYRIIGVMFFLIGILLLVATVILGSQDHWYDAFTMCWMGIVSIIFAIRPR